MITIGDSVQKVKSGHPSQISNGNFTYIDIAAVSRDKKVIEQVQELPVDQAPSRARQFVRQGDVLVSTVRPNLNAVAMIGPEHNGAVASTGFTVLRPKTDILEGRFLFHVVRSPDFVQKMAKRATGASYPAISDNDVREYRLPKLSLTEQRRIADILDRTDTLKRKRQQALQLADDFLTSSFDQLYKTEGDLNIGWKKYKLIDLGTDSKSIVNGPFGSDLLTSELTDEGVPVVYIRDIRESSYLRVSKSFVTAEKASKLAFCNVQPNDVLIAKVGDPPGTAALYPTAQPEAIVTQDVVRIRPAQSLVRPEVLVAWLNSPLGRRAIASIEVEATRSRFSLTQFKQLAIWVPPIHLQDRFCHSVHKLRKAQLVAGLCIDAVTGLSESLATACFGGSVGGNLESVD